MKDEELLAEEYICNGKCQDDITKNYVHCKTCTRLKDFLTGLKAGRPQRHDLRKDPNDLPKDDENFICMLENGYRMECYYDPTSKRWYDNFFHHDIEYGYYQSKVIAWCEIPIF